jgi:hypothetical protein
MPQDSGLVSDILRELGEKPDPAASDTDEPEAESEEPAAEEESGTEAPAAETDEAAAGESDEPAAEGEEPAAEEGSEEPAAEGEEGEEGEEPADPTKPKAKDDKDKTAIGLKRELFKLREELRQLKAAGAQPARQLAPSELEIEGADSPERLEELREHFERLEDLALANRDGLEVPAAKEGDEPKVYTKEQMGQILTNARRALRAIPKRQTEIVQETRSNQVAVQIYPGFEDPESDESRALDHVLKTVPGIRKLANYRLVIADAVAGERIRIAKAKQAAAAKKGPEGRPLAGKAAAPAARRSPAPVPGAPHRAPSAPAPKAQRLAKARKRAESGSEADIAELIEAGLG